MSRTILRVVACALWIFSIPLVAEDAQWLEAKSALESRRYEQAANGFSSWIAANPNPSAEAFYNLAFAEWNLGRLSLSAEHMLRAAHARQSLWRTISDLDILDKIQKQIGLPLPATDSFPFQVGAMAKPWLILILAVSGFWLLFFSYPWPYPTGWKQKSWRPALAVAGVCLLILSSIPALLHPFRGEIGVLAGSQDSIPLYAAPTKNSTADDKGVLGTLPLGTVVLISRRQPGYALIKSPLNGWIQETDLVSVVQ